MKRPRLSMTPPATIRLTILADMLNDAGEPRAGLMLPLPPNSTSRRMTLAIFPTLAAALAEKARLEREASW
jgi:hypothetical protein